MDESTHRSYTFSDNKIIHIYIFLISLTLIKIKNHHHTT